MTTFYLKHTKSGKVDMRTKAGKAWAVLKKNAVKVSRDGNTVWSNYKRTKSGKIDKRTAEGKPRAILMKYARKKY